MARAQRPPRRVPVGCIALCLAGVAAAAGAVEERHGPFAVDAVTLEGLSGRLDVKVGDGREVALVVSGAMRRHELT